MKQYPAKLLLFGEHVLLLGATALAVPVPLFSGHWDWENDEDEALEKQQQLRDFACSPELSSIEGLDTESFNRDLDQGLYFSSNIPTGYGLGSSGALCAAIYDRYAGFKTGDLSELKDILASMERFFHGRSSGIDPLTSYTAMPLLIEQQDQVSAIQQDVRADQPLVFLLDSRLPRQTGPLVQWFLEQSRNRDFADFLENRYLPVHEAMLAHWQQNNIPAFWADLQQISGFQLAYFQPMIPVTVKQLWQEQLEKGEVLFKICGAGGGGYVLGFTRNNTLPAFIQDEWPVVFPFHTHTENDASR